MTPPRRRPPPFAAVTALAALTSLTVFTATAASYAVERPHTHEEYVAHTSAVPLATPLPTSGLPTGDVPSIAYAFATRPAFGEGDWRLKRPDGTSTRLPRLTWSVWAPMGGGALGMAGTETGLELQRVDDTGEVSTRTVPHFGLDVSPDHEIVGWLGDHGRAHVLEAGGTRQLVMPRVPGGRSIGGIRGEQTCQEQAPEGGGCTVFVNARRHAWVTTSHGTVSRVGPMLRVSDVSRQGRVIGLVSRRTSERRACWGVFRAGGHRVFRSCRYYLDVFSPDGRRVLAERSQTRWWSVRRFAVLGRDGHLVRAWTFDAGRHRTLGQLVWEDQHHLLGVLLAHGRWGLVRIGTDGSVEYAGPTVAATDEFTPYDLPLH
jgi:hypothetical protein